MAEDELKHWGILNMKWHIRRFQNPDGSLTELGREHYNVGPPRTKGKDTLDNRNAKQKDKRNDKSQNNIDNPNNNNKEHNKSEYDHNKSGKSDSNRENSRKPVRSLIKGINKLQKESAQKNRKPEEMSDDELYRLSKRYKAMANYYNAQNDYLKNQAYNKDLTTPKKKTNQFLYNIFVRPLETVLSKSVEFGLYSTAESFLGTMDQKSADQYMNFVMGKKDKSNDKPNDRDKDKDRKRD